MNLENYISFFRHKPVMRSYISGETHCLPSGRRRREPVCKYRIASGIQHLYSIDPSQHNDTSVRSSVKTTEGLESHGSGSSQTPECIPGRPERLPVPRGVEDKCGDNILIKIKPIVAFLGRKRFLPFYIKLSKEENHA